MTVLAHLKPGDASAAPGSVGYTCLRAGDASYFDVDGILRFARYHRWTWSEDFSNAAWTLNNATVGGTIAAPLGGGTAQKIVEDTNNSTHGIQRDIVGLPNNALVTLSVYAKAGERTWLRVASNSKVNPSVIQDPLTWFNLATGVIGTISPYHTPFMVSLGAG